MDRGLIIRKLGALMQNLQALTVFFPIDFGWGCCAPSDLDPTPEIKGSRGRWRCSPEQAGLALQRVFWPTVWSRSMRATRVDHWGHLRGAVGYVAV